MTSSRPNAARAGTLKQKKITVNETSVNHTGRFLLVNSAPLKTCCIMTKSHGVPVKNPSPVQTLKG